jgi:hypothetical protein
MNLVKQTNPLAMGRSALSLAGSLARGAARVPVGMAKGAFHVAGAAAGLARSDAPERAEVSDRSTAVPDSGPGAPSGPTVVLAEPHAPDEPPVDVVGAALAAEEAAEGRDFAHEPRAASRDEEHGAAALDRATVDDIAEETAAALEGDVEPEPHLTQPLFDAGDAKAAAAEMATMSKAADPDKG